MTRASFLSIPPDVLDRIALQTVHQPAAATSDFASRLRTLSSLLILCRGAHASLSPSNNPYLYGEIFRMLFDVAPVQRRLGTEAVRSATLTYELQRRLTMLKKLKAYLVDKMNDNDNSQPRPEPTVLDLTLLLLMLTENDGKNSQQLRYIFGLSGLADLCGALLSSSTCRYNSGAPEESEALAKIKSLAMAILWINPEEVFEYESVEKTNAILDILEPLAIQSNVDNTYHYPAFTVDFMYFGLSGSLVLSALAYTRLCVVERYDVIRRRQSVSLPASPSRALTSRDMDSDFGRLTRFHQHPPCMNWDWLSHLIATTITTTPRPLGASKTVQDNFETEWNGGWFVPNFLGSSVYTVFQPMKFRIRAYTPTSSDGLVHFVNTDTREEGEELSKAWFNEGVEFSEKPDSLSIFDPITGRTSCYEPRSADRTSEEMTMADTILCGETITAHGSVFGNFVYRGRIRQSDGKIALIRKPANPDMDDLGVWVFHGYLYGSCNFVGDWWNTSTAKHTPGGSGWFRFIGNS